MKAVVPQFEGFESVLGVDLKRLERVFRTCGISGVYTEGVICGKLRHKFGVVCDIYCSFSEVSVQH